MCLFIHNLRWLVMSMIRIDAHIKNIPLFCYTIEDRKSNTFIVSMLSRDPSIHSSLKCTYMKGNHWTCMSFISYSCIMWAREYLNKLEREIQWNVAHFIVHVHKMKHLFHHTCAWLIILCYCRDISNNNLSGVIDFNMFSGIRDSLYM